MRPTTRNQKPSHFPEQPSIREAVIRDGARRAVARTEKGKAREMSNQKARELLFKKSDREGGAAFASMGAPDALAAAGAGAACADVCVPARAKRNSTTEVMVASMVGTAIEFYDNYCYSIAAASYFGLIFFTDVAKSDPVLATLLAFVTFAVSFLARPFGSLLFGHFGDRLGRKKTLVAALLLMGCATFCVGLLPGYDVLGASAVVLLSIAAHM